MNTTFLVVWSLRILGHDSEVSDHWEAFGTLAEAEARYDSVMQFVHLYSASICGVIESTDYGPHPAFLPAPAPQSWIQRAINFFRGS